LADLRLLLGRAAVFLRQVLGDVLALGAHLRVQLEGLEADVGRHLAVEALQGLLQPAQADGAPGAGDVGDEIDGQAWGVHGAGLSRLCLRDNAGSAPRPCPPKAFMTDRYAVIGHPISHSKSPQIHAAFARATGQDIAYTAIEAPLDGFAATVQAFRASGGRGVNVTLPFKLQACELATDPSE